MKINEKYAAELSYISKWTGSCEDIVQAGGGNTSVKQDENVMLIKSSGYALSDVTASEGFSVVDHGMINEYLAGGVSVTMEQDILKKSLIYGKRPSIETFLHSITKKYTIHSHPLSVTMLAVQKGGMDILAQLFPKAVFVEYAVPGMILAEKLYDAMMHCSCTDIIFLQNHGLIVSADTMQGAVKLHKDVIIKINEYLGVLSEEYLLNCRLFDAINSFDNELIVYCCSNEYIKRALCISGGKEWIYKFTPDCIVYCGGGFAVIKKDDDIEKCIKDFIEKNGMPKVIIIGEYVFVAAENLKKAKDIESVLSFTAKIFVNTKGELCTLNDSETEFILNWDSEKYRRSLKATHYN